MNQTEECAAKSAFDVIISYDNAVGKLLIDLLAGLTVTDLSYVLTIVLLQELTMFSLQVTSLLYLHGFIMISPLSQTGRLLCQGDTDYQERLS